MKTLILLLLFSTVIVAQTPPQIVASPSPRQLIETQETKETAILKAQLEIMREYNERLLNTVYWSLGTLVVIAVLLVGFSWFTNYKIYERDKAALRQELSGAVDSQILGIRNKLNEDLEEKLKEISTKSVDAAKANSELAISPIKNQIESLERSVKNQIQSLEKSVLRLNYHVHESEAWYWELKGVKANEMDRYREMLAIAVELKDSSSISASLESLTRMFKDRVFPFYAYVPDLVTLLDSLPSKYSTEVEALKNLLKNTKTS